MITPSILSGDEWSIIFTHLSLDEINDPFAQVCKAWNILAFKILHEIGLNLLKTKVLNPGKYGNPTDFKVISWTLGPKSVTAAIISKFIRGHASELSLLKIINSAEPKIVNYEQMSDARHMRRSTHVILALARNNPQATKSCIIDAILYNNRPVLQILLDPETPKYSQFSLEWIRERAAVHSKLPLMNSISDPNEILQNQQIIKVKEQRVTSIFQYNKSFGVDNQCNIEHLDLRDVELRSLDDYKCLLSNFPYLKTLYIDDTVSKNSHKIIFKINCLENLKIKSKFMEEFSDFDNLIHLKKLSLNGSGNLKRISKNIKYLKKLEVLDLRFTGLCTLPDLTENNSLKVLKIQGCTFDDKPDFYNSMKRLMNINPYLKIDFDRSFNTF
ncbi:MAG: hypothetical protein H0U49_08255 [Parachlamydiaceae bacterium]|nr:hypothetical protein [Parachlamydiaceae bacterium]